uniref:Transmembrane protein 170B n=1 Tax=Meleagris gallopavo TaxID=9103 RepID=A0A803YAM9_MELGA
MTGESGWLCLKNSGVREITSSFFSSFPHISSNRKHRGNSCLRWRTVDFDLSIRAEMWYWVFLWALFSSLFVHGAVGVLMFVMLQRHRQGRLISVIVVSIGFLGSVTGAMITSAAVAGIYRVAGKNMAPLEALVFGVGQTVLTLIISFSRILATL